MNNQIYAALLPDSQAHTPPARQSTTTDNTVWGPDTSPSAWECQQNGDE